MQIIPNEDGYASNLYSNPIDEFHSLNFLKYFTVENITALSWKKRYGFLHVIEDIMGVFDEFRVRPFLDLLMGCVVRVLASCSSNIDTAKVAESSPASDHPDVEMISDDKDSAEANHVKVIFPVMLRKKITFLKFDQLLFLFSNILLSLLISNKLTNYL